MPYCKYCGAEIDSDALFCTKCGQKTAQSEPQPPALPETPPVPTAETVSPVITEKTISVPPIPTTKSVPPIPTEEQMPVPPIPVVESVPPVQTEEPVTVPPVPVAESVPPVPAEEPADGPAAEPLEEEAAAIPPTPPTVEDGTAAKPEKKKSGKSKRKSAVLIAVIAAVAVIVATVVTIFVMKGNKEDEVVEYAGYMMSDQYKYDLKVMERATDLNADLSLLCLDLATNGFSEEIGDDTEEYFNANKEFYWKALAKFVSQSEDEGEALQRSCDRLMDHEVFSSSLSFDENGEARLVKYGEDGSSATAMNRGCYESPLSMLATPAHAAPSPSVALPLLSESIYNMAMTARKTSRNTRRQTVTIANELSNKELKELFDNLPNDEKFGETNYQDWWQNLSDGHYDKHAFSIYSSLTYGNDCPAKQKFMEKADDMGVDSRQEYMKIVKEYVKAGANLTKDLDMAWLKVVSPAVGESFATGVDYGTDALKVAKVAEERTKEIETSLKEGKVVFDPVNRLFYVPASKTEEGKEAEQNLKDMVTGRLWDAGANNGGQIKVGKFFTVPMDKVGGSELVEIINVGKDLAKEYLIGETDKPQIDWIKKMEPSTFILKDDDTESPAVMAVLFNPITGEVITCDEKNENGEFVINLHGNDSHYFHITLYDENGDKMTSMLDIPKEGESVSYTFTTDEKSGMDAISEAKEMSEQLDEKMKDELNNLDETKDNFFTKTWKEVSGQITKSANKVESLTTQKEILDAETKDAEQMLKQKIKDKEAKDKEKAEQEEERRKQEEERRKQEEEAGSPWYTKVKETVVKWLSGDDDDEEEESDRGWFERLGDKVKQTVQKNIDDWLGNGSSTATDDDDDADDWGSAPVVKDDKQKEREKLSGMDQNFMVGRWSVKMMSAGNQYSNQPIPKGIIPNITVVFKPNGRWSGHVDAITIANSVTIPGQDTSGTYTFDGFNLKYGTGEVFVVTKISENEIATRDINSGATARMTRAD